MKNKPLKLLNIAVNRNHYKSVIFQVMNVLKKYTLFTPTYPFYSTRPYELKTVLLYSLYSLAETSINCKKSDDF